MEKLTEVLKKAMDTKQTTNVKKAKQGDESEPVVYVKLVSSDSHEFVIKQKLAFLSKTLKAMLDRPGYYDPSDANTVYLKQIPSCVLHKVCQYFAYKHCFDNNEAEIPPFPIEQAVAFELLMAANFLDC